MSAFRGLYHKDEWDWYLPKKFTKDLIPSDNCNRIIKADKGYYIHISKFTLCGTRFIAKHLFLEYPDEHQMSVLRKKLNSKERKLIKYWTRVWRKYKEKQKMKAIRDEKQTKRTHFRKAN